MIVPHPQHSSFCPPRHWEQVTSDLERAANPCAHRNHWHMPCQHLPSKHRLNFVDVRPIEVKMAGELGYEETVTEMDGAARSEEMSMEMLDFCDVLELLGVVDFRGDGECEHAW
jgi:hypothetical protein